MSDPISLSLDEYKALISLAKKDKSEADLRVIETFLKNIDRRNGLVRYQLRVRWQEPHAVMTPMVTFPQQWPPNQDKLIERTDRSIAKADVMEMLRVYAKEPTNILVTKDYAGILGWTKLDDFFQ